MRIIHDVFPNGVPIVLVARMDNDDRVVPDSIKLHPVVHCEDLGAHLILEPLPFEEMTKIIPRLEKYKDNETS
jgi:hypothetical protein